MTTANKITLVRIACVPIFMAAILMRWTGSDLLALVIFIVASATDCVDGYVARRYNQITTFGKFIDPLADKLLVTAALLVFVERGQMPSWAAMIVVAREFAVMFLRIIALDNGVVLAAGISGKIKTVVSLIGISYMMSPWRYIYIIPDTLSANDLAAALIVLTTVWSGVEYFVKNGKMLTASK